MASKSPNPNPFTEAIRSRLTLLPLNEVATLLGMHRLTLHQMTREGKIRHFRVGGRIKFAPQIVADYLDERDLG